jgi:hypothetical protein
LLDRGGEDRDEHRRLLRKLVDRGDVLGFGGASLGAEGVLEQHRQRLAVIDHD